MRRLLLLLLAGYALLANAFISAINEKTGAGIALINLAQVHRDDPYSVSALRAAGLPCAGR